MSATALEVDRRPPAADVASRLGRLAAAVERSAERRGPEPWAVLLVLGGLSVGAGVAAIALGWYGAAHSPYLFQEVPYVISGGLLGLALVVTGAALVLGSWVVRLVQEAQRAAGRLDEIAELLAGSRLPAVPAGDHAVGPPAAAVEPAGGAGDG